MPLRVTLDPGAPAAPGTGDQRQGGALPYVVPAPPHTLAARNARFVDHGFGVVAVMELKKLTAGDGYTYLVRHVAAGDVDLSRGQTLEGYYAAGPNPPGMWIGRGAPELGLAGQQVSQAQMRNLFGLGRHPGAEAIIDAHVTANVTEETTDAQARRIAADAQRAAALGRGFTTHRDVPPLDERVTARLAELREATGREPTPAEVGRVRGEETRRADAAIAGYDLVFAPPKSMALLWSLHPDPAIRAGVERAHEEAMAAALALIEDHAAFTRTGAGGVAQIATKGLTAAAFRHHDSRDGDPNLHTHVVVSNKVCGVDGVWRALDARGLHAMKAAASDTYNTQLTARVRAYTGADVTPKVTRAGREPVWEIAGIPAALIEHFSTRRTAIAPLIEELTDTYRREHGRAPDAAARQAIGRQATLATRAPKKDPKSLPQQRAQWTARARAGFGRDVVERIEKIAPGPRGRRLALDLDPPRRVERSARWRSTWRRADAPGGVLTVPEAVADLARDARARASFTGEIAREAVAKVAESRSTWSRWNVHAAAQRILRDPSVFERHGVAEPAPEALTGLVEQAVTVALDTHSIRLTADPLVAEPKALRRADGTSVFAVHGADRYTSAAVLDAEARLVEAATSAPGAPLLLPEAGRVAAALDGFAATPGGRELDAGQRALVEAFALDPRAVVAGIGPAGTGKTTAMRALNHALNRSGAGRLIPLATSARSAAVLAEDLGTPAENVHAFLTAHGLLLPAKTPAVEEREGRPNPARLAQADVPERWRLHPGDVLLVDEAGMAGTLNLDRLLALAQIHGARVRLLGDDRQLTAVESGGALRLIVSEAGAVELDTVHRFAHAGEATAAAKIRVGDAGGLDHYQARGLIVGGEHVEMAEAAYTGWLADVRQGRISLLITGRNEDVTALSARARADRVAAGQVEQGGVGLHDGNTAGVGDWVVVRENDRRIRSTGGRVWARNGEDFTVTHRGDDGGLTVRHRATGAILDLPAEYVARAVELAYATTIHRAQGATVDTAHALVTARFWREQLYVAAARARLWTRLYVATHAHQGVGEDAIDQHAWEARNRTARSVLEGVLGRESSEPAATATAAREAERQASLAALVPRHAHAHAVLTAPYYRARIRDVLGEKTAEVLGRDPQASAVLVQVLRQAHHGGWDPADALTMAAAILPSVPVDALPTALDASRTNVVDARSEPVLAHRLARAVENLTAHHPAPTPQAQPTRADRARYARLLAERRLITGEVAPLGRATAVDATPAGRQATVARLLFRPAFEAAPDHVDTARRVLDRDTARALTTSPGWGRVAAGLHRAGLLGHDPAVLLREAARQAEDRQVGPVTARALAARVEALATAETPATLAALRDRDVASRPVIFDAITRVLKAHEQAAGTDPAALLPSAEDVAARATRGESAPGWAMRREQDARLFDTLAYARRQAARAHEQDAAGPLPWVPAVLPGTTTGEHATYLSALSDTIRARVERLRQDALITRDPRSEATAPAARDLGATFGTPGPGHARAWADAVAVVAAHREQHRLTEQPAACEPNAPAQVLGPFPTPDAGAAYAHTYWAAAHAAVAARHHTDPDPTAASEQAGRSGVGGALESPTRGREAPTTDFSGAAAVDRYRQLDRGQRAEVAALVLGRLGALPDPPAQAEEPEAVAARARAVDDAMTHPANTAHLHRALHDLDLSEPEAPGRTAKTSEPGEHQPTGPRDPVRKLPAGHRVDLPARPARRPQTTPPAARPAQRPAVHPAPQPQHGPEPRWDATPQPGRVWSDPYADRQPRPRW